jgi:hypothetical protein
MRYAAPVGYAADAGRFATLFRSDHMRLAPSVNGTGWWQHLIHLCRSCLSERQRPDRALFRRRRWKSAIGALLLSLAFGAGCRSPAAANSLGEWEQLLHRPGVRIPAFDVAPDGTLFIATPGAIFRAEPNRPDEWSLVTNTDRFVVELHAVSRDRVFAFVRYGEVYRWAADSGWGPVGEISDSLVLVDGGTRRAFLLDWWIPEGANEIYLAGQAGLVLRYDGSEWTRMPSEGLPSIDWTQIDGDASKIVVAGEEIWEREDDTWHRIPGSATDSLQCGPLAVVVRPTDVIIAGHWIALAPCLMRFQSGTWRTIGDGLRDFRDRPFWGDLQSDGSALIWSTSGDVARVMEMTATLYPMPYFSAFSGAALHEGYLYFAGTLDGDGIVGRIRQP